MCVCIIGAGAAGIASARALQQAGLPFDWFEKESGIGGNWRSGVYDSTCLISSRNTSGFPDLQMPADWPNFPRREQVLEYLQTYAERFGLMDLVTLGIEVERVEPMDAKGLRDWKVWVADGRELTYDAVIVANGHLWDPRVPEYPGNFSGNSLHSREYRRPQDLEGERVLIVGAGNSGCDIAVEAAQNGRHVELSIRRGHWFIPKSLLGMPRGELKLQRLPRPLRDTSLQLLAQVAIGRPERYGLPRPDHRFGTEPPVVSSQLFHHLDHGTIRPRPGIERFDGRTVHYVDRASSEIDTIVWATGYRITFPFLDPSLLPEIKGVPARLAVGTLAPGLAGLYFVGLVTPGGGNFPIHHAQAWLVADMIAAQTRHSEPLARKIFGDEQPSTRMYAGVPALLSDVAAARRKVASHGAR